MNLRTSTLAPHSSYEVRLFENMLFIIYGKLIWNIIYGKLIWNSVSAPHLSYTVCVCVNVCVWMCVCCRSLLHERTYKRDCILQKRLVLFENFWQWHQAIYSAWHLGLVSSLKVHVSCAEYSLFYRYLLQKRPTSLRSLLIVTSSHLLSSWLILYFLINYF